MFIEADIKVNAEGGEILIAELAEIGFSTFEESTEGIKGFIDADEFKKKEFDEIINKYKLLYPISYSLNKIEKKNWNEEWERNFQPIEINGACRIRASFHEQKPEFKYDIVINPKMTFGTGHHNTTALMMEFQLNQDYKGKRVADIGCGTGILAILASRLGAEKVIGVEVEDWSVENARENAEINQCKNIEILHGRVSEANVNQKFDIILANINKNVLLDELPQYKNLLNQKGELLMSGFYAQDITDIEQKAVQSGLLKSEVKTKDNWAAVLFKNQ